ncbi:TRAP transporter large permease [Dethiosulfovibrio salsuginis]|uniref:TRAP transporter, DctM subunit n=1 Tax=Dethiosulfovibrio salsuginis TaxID=561720 RepID=A0A1X7IHH7_9BACT|nr:TRAP transporter large permease [Dethiosulfovibrio salsuginis]SMG13882.1 TRAP transporter, DctM subunit [Dethiosulfovibrio salsuginis]
MTGLLILGGFFLQMALGVPLYASLLFTGFLGILTTGNLTLLRAIPQQFFGGMDVFSLMAIPFFILAGSLMNRSGLTDRLIDFSRLLVGSVRGGLGYVNVVGGIILAGVNGSAAADASALGSILIPAMEKEGFPRAYAAGLTAGSSLIGPIIPPSIFMIIYAAMTNTSIGGLFAAGVVPGLVLGLAFMAMNWFFSRRYNVPMTDTAAVRARAKVILRRSVAALVAPFIIVGGIVTGVVTPTESGALAVVYCLLAGIAITRELTWSGLTDSIYETVRLTSAIFMIMGAATVVGWFLKWERVTQKFASILIGMGLLEHPWLLLIVLSSIIFVIGMFMEEVAVLTLLTPIFAPLAVRAGIDPFHFGIVMTLNVTIALITPPVGACNYIVAAVGKVPLGDLFREIWPFIAVAMTVLLAIISFPAITVTLPKILGL